MKRLGYLVAAVLLGGVAGAGEVVLFDAATADVKAIRRQDGATFTLEKGLLTVKTEPSSAYPGFAVKGDWDLSNCGEIEVEFVNGGNQIAKSLHLVTLL